MGASTTAQINVRIDPALKEAGDQALARLGSSPSEAIRSLWTKFARSKQDAEEVYRVLTPQAPTSPEVERRLAAIDAFEHTRYSFENKLSNAGVNLNALQPLDREQVYEARYQDYLDLRGE